MKDGSDLYLASEKTIEEERRYRFEGNGMKCPDCGTVNPEGQKVCSSCGLEFRMNAVPYRHAQQSEFELFAAKKMERFIYRLFGGLSWIMVSIGTFMIAFGYLGLVNSSFSFYDDPQNSLNLVGYGLIVYAIAAVFVGINRFVRNP